MTGTGTTVPVADINRQAPDAPLSKKQQKMLKRKAEAEAAESGAGSGASSNAKKAKGGSLSENVPNEPLAKLLDNGAPIEATQTCQLFVNAGCKYPKPHRSQCNIIRIVHRKTSQLQRSSRQFLALVSSERQCGDNVSIANHFSEDVIHTAIVGGKDIVGYRILRILVSKSDEYPMPPTPPGSELKVRFMPGVAEAMYELAIKNKGKGKQPGQNEGEEKTTPGDGEPAVDSATAIVDVNAMEIEDPTPAEASKNKNQAKGKGKSNKWQKQQAKAKQVKKGPVFQDASLIVSTEIKVCLTMTRNAIPQIRQMKAIASICKKPAVHNVKHAMLQNLLLGDDIYTSKDAPARTVQEDHFSRMEDVEKRAFNDFRDACNFNGPQKDFWQGVFGTTKFMTSATLGFALSRIKTLLTAPSNTAAQDCMRKLVGHLKTLYEVCPESENWFKVVYLPTESATRRDLSEQDDIDAEIVSDMVADGEQPTEDEGFEKYKLWNLIVQAYKNDATDKTMHQADDRRKNARTWLSTRKTFVDLTKAMAKKIFEDHPIRIVVCTSSTSALLEEYKWTPWAVLIDEASAGSEPDSYVPLAFKPRRSVLAGDLEKVKLLTRSSGHNEFADQLGLSLYERLYGNPTMPLYRLKINCRMHPDIAELHANSTYEWLESDDSTSIPSDEFKFFEDWWYSEPAKIYRENRRKPEFGLNIDESRIHRMFVNVKNGESAPKPGSQSQLNHANINAIANMVMSIMKHQPTRGLAPLPFDKISIFTPYKAENMELVNQVKMRIRHVWGDAVGRFPLFTTIDSTQGGQNEIILLSLTPANKTNGSKIGFLKE
ncbi:hypothetical protein BCON_0203g00250 [Botryotinia convoluta]|uniref:DNA2/NAM7 helicase-like C-terminal domain-containing protein n=1 Tax=Botryotinia convoluta TaxID=54673 RepID=A0A4Z1HQV2_9HELO|nr:hypothetical protein BCON_0203g00250 [Botryotinia convoluta]